MEYEKKDWDHTVAIFGGNEPTETVKAGVRLVAQAIATARAVVLTGGDGKDSSGVKGEALNAVETDGRWIGVLNSKGANSTSVDTATSLLLDPRLGHQRNLLEAWLCDAAVVFEGGRGTASECVSSLCLGRPVLLVGDRWHDDRGDYDLPALFAGEGAATTARSDLVKASHQRLGLGGAMGSLVRTDVKPDRLVTHENCQHISVEELSLEPDGRLLSWLTQVVATTPFAEFPDIAELRALKQAHREWMAGPRA